ncbi:DUF4367 domain-containing protein [Oscillibacter sp.]|uniref:DUF4367 domain-containing protein n=1 Tax=Oscillibacter sp. TaxID=1945593 RepID=UPI0028969FE5|nr:DUF4367 domain-containing protein [Oscillibacter sp.]
MPDEGKKQSYPFLEHMSTEDLEKMLSQDFIAPDDAAPDIDYIMAIMEVIQKREAKELSSKPVDVDAAWQDFKENYEGQVDSFEIGNLQEPDSSHPLQIEKKINTAKRFHILRYIGIAAAVIVLLCGAASAFGFDIFQALADWTNETFGFVSSNGAAQQTSIPVIPQDDPYSKLRTDVADETDILLIPTWAPEGTEETGNTSVVKRMDSTRIFSSFTTNGGEFTINIQIYDALPDDYRTVYQKDDRPMQEYETNGVTYYIMHNNATCGVAWTNENIECAIQGDLGVEDLEKMVDSIYGE